MTDSRYAFDSLANNKKNPLRTQREEKYMQVLSKPMRCLLFGLWIEIG
jgi:hypothetical protein